jgi:tetratricopeptide (TPR) repeat protein
LDRFLGGLRVVGLNAYHLVFPVELAPDYSGGHFDLSGSPADPRLWAGVALLAGSILGVAWGGRQVERVLGRSLFLAGVILIGSAFVVMNLAFDLETVLGDRLLYWPSVAWVLALVSAAASFWKTRTPFRRRIRPVAAIGVLVALGAGYAVRSAAYLPAWKDNYTLFSRASQVVPEVPRVWYNLGLSQRKAGQPDEALASFRRARTLADDHQEAWTEEATLLMASGRWDEAKTALEAALRLAPTDPVVLTNHAVLLLREGKADAAVTDLRTVLDTDPRNVDALYNLGVAERKRERYEAAAEAWYRYLEERPGDAGVLVNMAWLLATNLDRGKDAEDLARRAVAAESDDAYAYDALAEALSRQGKKAEAVEAALEAVRLHDASSRTDILRYKDRQPDYFRNRLRRIREATGP